MSDTNKVSKPFRAGRDPKVKKDLVFSLGPLGAALAFFLVFIWLIDIPDKDVIIVTGAAAGIIGLASYGVFRGWRKKHVATILLGLTGIAVTIAIAWSYMVFA
jgi:hypothetical protein